MGILKHFVLPIFAAGHAVFAKICLYDEGLVEMAAPGMGRDIVKEPPTPMERLLTRTIGGVQLALVVNAVAAIFQETAHYRGMAVLLEAIYFTVDSYSIWKAGKKDGMPVYCMMGLSLVGLGVHAMEPGVFTKDKRK